MLFPSCRPVSRTSHPASRRVALAVRLALAGLPLAASAAHAQSGSLPQAPAGAQRPHDIPAGPLSVGIARFVAASGALIAADGALTQGKTSSALQGSYPIPVALARLLAGTSLESSLQADGSYVLRTAAMPPLAAAFPPPALSEDALPEVRVRASVDAFPGDAPKPYAGGQVARGGRVGVLGDKDVFETPFNVTNFTAQSIADQQATKVAEVVKGDPSVKVISATGNYSEEFLIRGFRVNQHSISFDGVSGTIPNYGAGALQHIERVEVFKGANTLLGGLTGGIAVGGNINLVPKRATDKPVSQVTTSFASDSTFGAHLDLGRRFGVDNQFGLRFNGYVQNGDLDADDVHERRHLAALAFDYRGDRARLFVDLGEQLQNTRGAVATLFADAGIAIPRAPKSGTNFAQPYSFSDTRARYGVIRGEFDIAPDLTVYAVHGGHDNRYSQLLPFGLLLDGAGTVDEVFQNGKGRDKERTTEVGVRAKLATGPVKHQFVVSAKRTRFDSHALYVFSEADGTAPTVRNNIYRPVRNAAPTRLFFRNDLPRENILKLPTVAFTDTLSILEDRAQLTLGVRRQRIDTKRFDSGDSGPNAVGDLLRSYNDSAWTPAIAGLFKLTSVVSIYGNYIESLTAGPTAPSTAINRSDVFPPSKTRQYEVGVKVDFGEFAVTADAFNIEQPGGITDPSTNRFSLNGEQRNRGMEFNVFGQLAPSVRLNGGVAFLDAKLTKTEAGLLDGKRVGGVPRTTLALSGEWDVAAGWTLTGDVQRTGRTFVDQGNTQSVSSYTIADVGFRYKTSWAGSKVTLRASVTNVADKDHFISDPFGSFFQGAPRAAQVSATVDF